jgi:opacity protein-like surface antigen
MVNVRRVMVVLAFVLVTPWIRGQCQTSADESVFRLVYAPRDKTIEILGGMTVPLSHDGITDFWMRGPGANVCLMVRMRDNFKVGVGGEAVLFSFRRAAFGERYPGVTPEVKDLGLLHVYLAFRNYIRPSLRFSPYIGAEVGFARLTAAEQKEVINGVLITYYDVPGTTRLTFGASAGVDYYISRTMALQLDIRGMFMNNDPDLGITASVRLGVKFSL